VDKDDKTKALMLEKRIAMLVILLFIMVGIMNYTFLKINRLEYDIRTLKHELDYTKHRIDVLETSE
jgi:CHASE3 domain sensor protein